MQFVPHLPFACRAYHRNLTVRQMQLQDLAQEGVV